MNTPFGTTTAAEVEVAHALYKDDQFDGDPVACYQELLTKHGVESTGRIWSLACKLYDQHHATDGR